MRAVFTGSRVEAPEALSQSPGFTLPHSGRTTYLQPGSTSLPDLLRLQLEPTDDLTPGSGTCLRWMRAQASANVAVQPRLCWMDSSAFLAVEGIIAWWCCACSCHGKERPGIAGEDYNVVARRASGGRGERACVIKGNQGSRVRETRTRLWGERACL